jgi:actin-related protein
MHYTGLRSMVVVVGVAAGLALAANQATAQMRMSPEDRTKQLKEQLALTPVQTDSVLVIFTAMDGEVKEAREWAAGDRDAMREIVMGIRDKYDKRIDAQLTSDQKKKYVELKKEWEARRKSGGPGGPGGPPPR